MEMLRWTVIIGSLLLLLLIFWLLRQKKLKEKYALIWIGILIVFIIISSHFSLIEQIGLLIGIKTPSNVLFFFGLIFSLMIMLVLTVIISIISNRVRILSQKIALMEYQISQGKDKDKIE